MRSFSDRHGAPPTVREIAERFRFTPRAAFDHLRARGRHGRAQARASDDEAHRGRSAARGLPHPRQGRRPVQGHVESSDSDGRRLSMLVAPMLVAQTRRTRRRSRPRVARRRRRIYVGRTVTRRAAATLFLRRTTQQVAARSRLSDWMGAVAMLGGMVAWGMILVLLGS